MNINLLQMPCINAVSLSVFSGRHPLGLLHVSVNGCPSGLKEKTRKLISFWSPHSVALNQTSHDNINRTQGRADSISIFPSEVRDDSVELPFSLPNIAKELTRKNRNKALTVIITLLTNHASPLELVFFLCPRLPG